MASYIKEDYEPAPRIYDLLRKYGAIPEFVESQKDHFMSYWLGLKDKGLEKGKKSEWDSTFLNWMKRAWNGKTGREWETHRHYQTRKPSTGNPFELALGEITGVKPEPKPKPRPPADYVIRTEMPESEPMSAEDAFQQLRNMGVL